MFANSNPYKPQTPSLISFSLSQPSKMRIRKLLHLVAPPLPPPTLPIAPTSSQPLDLPTPSKFVQTPLLLHHQTSNLSIDQQTHESQPQPKKEKSFLSDLEKPSNGHDRMHNSDTKDPLASEVEDIDYNMFEANNGRNVSAKACYYGISTSSSSSHQGGNERWCNGEGAIPLKKRRESFHQIIESEKTSLIMNKNKKRDVEKQEQGNEVKTIIENRKPKKKKASNNGAMIMEGSRCSRVNGRGWRCCQQTLVGYSLCEHHLGKARLRSIRNAPKKVKHSSLSLSVTLSEEIIVKEKTVAITKNKKIRMVKARSMSSLLRLTEHAPSTTIST